MKSIAIGLLFLTTVASAAPPPGKSLGYEHLRREAPDIGAKAPDFTLKSLQTGKSVTLSSFSGQRPIALIFGSYT